MNTQFSLRPLPQLFLALSFACFTAFGGCETEVDRPSGEMADQCVYVEEGHGQTGTVEVRAETVVEGLDVPWGIGFLPDGSMLITERAGRIRLVKDGRLVQDPVASMDDSETSEGGLLGILVHPEFSANRQFFIYRTIHPEQGDLINRVERWILSEDHLTARRDIVVLDNIPAARYHNGGRMRFGPDGKLYVGTGDTRQPNLAQDPESLAGKLLRINLDGSIPEDNPFPGSPVYLLGIRNTQGFDWPNDSTIWLTDHGPSGELGRSGHDEVNITSAGDNLGWPTIYGCERGEGMVSPSITWARSNPPGGAIIYTGNAISEWTGSLIIGVLGWKHLQRIDLDDNGNVDVNEVYFRDEYGRFRDVVMGPDSDLYVTTSNCDGRGSCPPEGDKVLRIVQ